MKSLYIVDYWVPFPSSEYGGVISLIAEDDTEAFELLANEEGFDEKYQNLIMPTVVKAQKFKLVEDYESGIIDAFTTWTIMTEQTLYRIEELTTSGWELVDVDYVQLNREQATEQLNQLIADGYNPNRLRAIHERWVPTPSTERNVLWADRV